MKKSYSAYVILPAMIMAISANIAFAQWPPYPDSNLVICDRSGEQTIPKIAASSDGGCYVSWYDHSSGNYDVYMQRLDGNGNIQWAEGGLLISNNPQDTWLTDYDLVVDQNDYAIVVFNDIRAGGDWDIYAYRISPTGFFAWGDNGLTLSDNVNLEAAPVVTITSSGNIAFAWMDEVSIFVRKVDITGADLWSPPTRNLTSTYGLFSPRIVAAENDGVIVSYMQISGPNYWDPKHLYARKFDVDGADLWGSSGVAINTVGGIALWMDHNLIPDGAGGAYETWYDDRDMSLNAYVQHILSNGNIAWEVNGVQLSLNAMELQMNPALVSYPASGEIIAFYLATDLDQNQNGVHGQKLDSLGTRQWGNNGFIFVPMSNQTRSHITAQLQADGAVVVYKEFPVDDVVNSCIKAIRVDMDGIPVWPTSPVEICSYLSEKIRIPTTVNPSGQVIAAWEDGRYDPSWDIYLQNVNPDGTLGPQGGSGCDYVVGDVNGSSSYNGLDITYGVAFFKGGPVPPYECECTPGNTWYVAGDVNNSCSYNGLDITYGVAFFKGGPDPMPCEDCPPVG
jgi:hypothetical protein